MADPTPLRVLQLLVERRETLATAESLTGGLIGEVLTGVPGASACYVGGVIAYATAVKRSLLGVTESTIREHGAVSAECALELARGAREATGATWAVSTTGVAGPDLQEGKPVGTVFVAVAGPGNDVRRLQIEGDRLAIRRGACEAALTALIEMVTSQT